jgi:cellulose synthase/poly-beta-1,6-N-acetylglucosamine synthase-like glycosyltransferase
MIESIQVWAAGSFSFLGNLLGREPEVLLRFFWLFFLFDLPRHLLLSCFVFMEEIFFSDNGVCRKNRREMTRRRPLVSIIIPAWNEQETISRTISSLEEQTWPYQEIIVVNDGSNDATPSICRELARRGRIRYFSLRERSGKSAALNWGVRVSKGEFIIFVDSDTFFDSNAVENLIGHFNDPRVGAVAGNLKVANRRDNLWSELQSLEYLLNIGLGRRVRARLRILSVIPGAFGGFRTSLITAGGGHDPGPGNDSDLTAKIRKTWARVAFAPDAVCFTRAPDNGYGFIKQRLRWSRCLISIRIRKHRSVFYPWNHNFSSTNLLAVGEPLFSHMILAGTTFLYVMDMAAHFPLVFPAVLLVNYLLYLFSGLLEALIAIALSKRRREDADGLLYLVLYHPFIWFHKLVRIAAYIQEIFFYSSYRDPFAPCKVRRNMESW